MLFILIGIIWLLFASIQDLRTKEVANWLSFSLIFIGLAARLFFSILENNFVQFYYGILSSIFITIIAFGLYFGKVFAGGDLKLMIGLGTFIPGFTIHTVILNCIASVVFLLLVGAIYSFLASIFIATKRRIEFNKEFKKESKLYFYIFPLLVILWIFLRKTDIIGIWILSFVTFILLIYPYLKSVDKCMIKEYNPNKLTEGDWLARDVKVGSKYIRMSVNGLTQKDIQLLIKARKKVMIKEGIPFVPAFLITFILMVLFFVLKGQDYLSVLFSSLF
jgi:Flp pilus assembly protein protease CpaA